jgi:hypothetical protein
MYHPIDNHFATLIDDDLYDATGKIPLSNEWFAWNNFHNFDLQECRRIYRDCIFQVSPEEWESFPRIIATNPWEFIP